MGRFSLKSVRLHLIDQDDIKGLNISLRGLAFIKPGPRSPLSQHSFDNNHYSAYYREIWKPRRETKKSHVPREKMLLTEQLIVQNRQSQSVLVKKKKSATFGLILRPCAGEMFPKVLHEMSVSNKCAPSEFDYLIAPWLFLQESQRQDNNTTESQKKTQQCNISSETKQKMYNSVLHVDSGAAQWSGSVRWYTPPPSESPASHHLVITTKFQRKLFKLCSTASIVSWNNISNSWFVLLGYDMY